MPTPAIVVFDLGKVLLDFDYRIAADKIARHSTMPTDRLKAHMDQSPLLLQYETGLVSRHEFFEDIRKASDFRGTFAEFCSYFGGIFTAIPEMIELHARLRAGGIPTYIFSNTNDLAYDEIWANFPFFRNFDGYIFSYEVRSMKPHHRIYEALEEMSGKRGAEILYLDDRPENIAAGAARGWQAILHENPVKSLAAVVQAGLLKDQ